MAHEQNLDAEQIQMTRYDVLKIQIIHNIIIFFLNFKRIFKSYWKMMS